MQENFSESTSRFLKNLDIQELNQMQEAVIGGYTINEKLTDKLGIGRTRFYITGQNVFIITKYNGLDPELGYTDGNKQINVDFAQYPQSRSWAFGVNVTF